MTPAATGSALEQAAQLRELEELVRTNQINERLAQLRTRSS
ncbi:hypothetical protein [Comamonas sp. C24C]